MMESLQRDLRHATRLLARAPAFTATTVLTLALAMGATTTVFSQIAAVFWTDLPLAHPESLRLLAWSSPKPTFVGMPNVAPGPHLPGVDTFGSFSYDAYVSMRDGAGDAIDLACWADLGETRPIVMRDVGFGTVHFISGNYFSVLGVHPELGRLLAAADDVPGTSAAVVSDLFWRRAFGADPNVLQRTIDLNGQAFSIVGVAPPGFFGVDTSTVPDVLVPVNAIQVAAATSNPLHTPSMWAVCRTVGRLRAGVADERARAELEHALAEAIQRHPPRDAYESPRVWLLDGSRGMATARAALATPLTVLMAIVVTILLIACANVAGLLTVRGAARERELATRRALGASRADLFRQLLTESLLLSAAGGVLGVAATFAFARLSPALLTRLMPTLYGNNRALGVAGAPDARALLFAIAVTVGCGVLFGSVSALRATHVDVHIAIKGRVPVGRGRARMSADRTMVGLQVALSILLLLGAGLLLQTLAHLRAAPLGYEPEGLLFAKIEPRTGGVPWERRGDFIQGAVERIAALPGITSASATDDPPFGSHGSIFVRNPAFPVCTAGFTPPGPSDPRAAISLVAPRYFATVRTPIVAGREFDWRDRPLTPQATAPTVVNEAFARRFFSGRNPLEQRIGLRCPDAPDAFAVVGVVADARVDPRVPVVPRVYFPLAFTSETITLVVRTDGPPEHFVATIRRAMTAFAANVPTFDEHTPVELRERRMREERLLTGLLIAFGAVALLLSAIGMYGMLAYVVVRRTRDIGVRIAVGARPADVVRQVVREAVAPVVGGLAAGMAVSLAVARSLGSLLYGVSTHDAVAIIGSAGVLLAVAAIATIVPARRAARTDPVRALRIE